MSQYLLRFSVAGSVDDGKSTLIGRLLFDSNNLYDDHIKDIKNKDGEINFSYASDGLKIEREKNITVDVAYKYFYEKEKKYILMDVPGHDIYTHCMASATSNSDACVILIDIKKGYLKQSKRHINIAMLFNIKNILIIINKLDSVDCSQQKYDQLCSTVLKDIGEGHNVSFVPVSALNGDNVVFKSEKIKWYNGPTVYEWITKINKKNNEDINYIYIQNEMNNQCYLGTLFGDIEENDSVWVMPLKQKVTLIDIKNKKKQYVSFKTKENLKLKRGDIILKEEDSVSNKISLNLLWFKESPLKSGEPYVIKHLGNYYDGYFEEINCFDLLLKEKTDAGILLKNQCKEVIFKSNNELWFKNFNTQKNAGSLIVVDKESLHTVGYGMIL